VVTVTVNELTMFTSEVAFQACTGTTVTYNGQSLAAGSVTSFDFTSVQGCDSVVTVTVEEVNAILETLTFEACVGQTIIYEGQSLPPGTSTDFPFQTPQGCDSIVTVIVNMLETYAENLFLETCEGEPVVYHNTNLPPGSVTPFTLTAANGCDSVVTVFVEEILVPHTTLPLSACSGETVFYQGQNLLPGTTMDFIFTAHTGCDSIVTVTVAELPAYASDLTLQACNGSTVVYNGVPLTPGTTVAFTFPAVNGCDSTVNVTVEEVDIFTTALSFDACQGETITYNGQVLLPNTITDFTYVSSIGCDSIVTVAVNELPAYDVPVLLQACTGSTVIYNGQQLSPGSVTSFNFNTVNGCDSIVTVTVEEVSVLTSSQSLSACEGTVAIYNGQALQPGTVTLFSFTSTQGCDSIVTVTVVGLPNQASSIQLAACDGETVVYNGQSLPAGTTIPFTFQTWQGCDSVVTVSVHAFPTQTSTLTLEACDGSSILYHGQSIAAGSTTDVILTSVNGCDSIVTVTVGALPHANSSVTLQGCEGESLVYNGQTIQPNTTETFTFTAFNGCDSLVTVTALPPVPKVETEETLEVCEGNSALIFGQEISIPGTYSQSFTGSNGCDSTHTVNLSVVDKVLLFFPADLTIELGDTVQLNPSVHPAGLSFVWEPSPSLSCLDCENPLAFPQQTTDYTVTASDPNGCEKTATQRVFVDKSRGVYVPNAFSPNGDGLNDFFMIYSDGRSVKEVKSFLVFSRWGESIYQGYHFQPDDPAFSWDGLHKGKELDPAVFVWFADIEFIDGVSQVFKGDVTLAK
jgi:gliding motility-associated-like protein